MASSGAGRRWWTGLPLPGLTTTLGRRRGWLLLSQAVIIAGLVGMALADPRDALGPIVWCALAVAFGSATQDIALDAYRIESADTQRQAALAATYQTGYRLAMIWAGAGVLWIAARAEVAAVSGNYQHAAWQTAYLVMAASMLVGVLTVLLSREPARAALPPARNAAEWLQGALVDPFADFIRRYRWQAALILALIAVYRISDVVMGIMANPFYVDMGYTKDEVAAVTKVYGVIMTLAGAFLGGALSMRFGVMRVLMLGAMLSAGHQPAVCLAGRARPRCAGADLGGVGRQPVVGHRVGGLHCLPVVLTNVSYSATQYALFSSMMLLLPKWLAGFSGKFVDLHGYVAFFNATAMLGVPVLVLVWLAGRSSSRQSSRP
jgi:PAT family beta-lactamase induction signal transducer AmpG